MSIKLFLYNNNAAMLRIARTTAQSRETKTVFKAENVQKSMPDTISTVSDARTAQDGDHQINSYFSPRTATAAAATCWSARICADSLRPKHRSPVSRRAHPCQTGRGIPIAVLRLISSDRRCSMKRQLILKRMRRVILLALCLHYRHKKDRPESPLPNGCAHTR